MLKASQLTRCQSLYRHPSVTIAVTQASNSRHGNNHVTRAGRRMATDVTAAQTLKRLEDIPGPARLPLLGTALDLVKGGGMTRLMDVHLKNFTKYGPIYREVIPGVPGRVMVNVAHPEAVETVYRAEGKYPERVGFDLFEVYWSEQKAKPWGIQLQGEEWFQSRQVLAPKMMVPKSVEESIEHFNVVANDAMERMRQIVPPDGKMDNMEDQVFKYSMESVALYSLGQRIGLFDEKPDEKVFEFMETGKVFFQKFADLLLGFPSYRYITTTTYRDFRAALNKIREIGQMYVNEKMKEIKEKSITKDNHEGSLLEYLLLDKGISPEEASTACVFQLLGGVDTTGYSIIWVMYHLAKHPESQERLYSEITDALDGEEPSSRALHKMPFLRACVKESQRLCPLAFLIPRSLKKGVSLLGYYIPKGTWINVHNYGMASSEKFFNEPTRYRPERWLRGTGDSIHPYAFLPFGHGPRQCIGRRVAELEMYIYLIKLVQAFKLRHEGLTGMTFKVGIYPADKMKFTLVER